METTTSIKLGKAHGTEYWAITSQTGGAAIIKRRGVRDFEDSDAEEAAKKLRIPKQKILEQMKNLEKTGGVQ